MSQAIRTTCPYCGVGCGLVASRDRNDQLVLRGDPDHPANSGRLCSKGAALAETLSLDDRLLHPQLHGRQCDWDTALDYVARGFMETLQRHGPESVAFYVSGQLLTEDYYVANKLMKGYIGTANIDTNSRLCMASTVAGYKRAFGADVVPCSYEDLEQAQLIVLVGSNAAWCHPVLYQRMVAARRNRPDMKLVVIDPRRTASCDAAELHLPIRPGSDVMLFNGLLAYLHAADVRDHVFTSRCTEGLDAALELACREAADIEEVARYCDVTVEALRTFYDLFARNERTVTVFSQGVNQSSSGTDKVNSIINCHLFSGRIGRPGMGPFSFTGQPNAMGGREVGGLSNQLAAHMALENEADRERVQRFWQSPRIADKPGLKAVELFDALDSGRIKAVWIMGTNPAVSLPDSNVVQKALRQCPLVVVSDCIAETDTTALADVLLPALAWGEKDGTVTNSERRISRQRVFLEAPASARADWWMLCQVATRMGYGPGFAYDSAADIFNEYAALTALENDGARPLNLAGLRDLSAAQYADLQPVQWPVTRPGAPGAERMYRDGIFNAADGKARFIAVASRAPAHAPDMHYPLVLNTGRVRDQWHTMTRSGKSARLTAHTPEPFVHISPRDSIKYDFTDGGLVEVQSRWGSARLRARVDESVRHGELFAPMHWSDCTASRARIDAVVNPAVDPVSGEPEFKHTPVRVRKYVPAWQGFLLSRRRLKPESATYWVQARRAGFWLHELAGEQLPADWAATARQLLCAADDEVGWIELFDKSSQTYRAARLVQGRLESCMFIARNPASLPQRAWLETLFGQSELSGTERRYLLSGKAPGDQPAQGRTVCACFGVGEQTILDAIAGGNITTVEQISDCLKAGSNCGSCLPELRALLAQAAVTAG